MAVAGANSNFERDLEKRLKALEKSIGKHTDNIYIIMTEALDKPSRATAYWVEVRKKLDIEYRALANIYTTWTKINIPIAYRRSLQELMTRLNRSKEIASRASRNFTSMATGTTANKISKALYMSANQDYLTALAQGKSELYKITRRTQQRIIAESLIDETVARAIENGNLVTEIRTLINDSSLASQFAKNAELINNKRYIMVNGRHYTPQYYASMVARVKFHEAQALSSVQTAQNYGTSLLRVSNHNTPTEVCQNYENKVYSIGGKDSRFPTLDATPPYHVNCLHLLFPVFESSMEATNTLNQWSEFSRGQTGTPPAPKDFVPINKRGA